MSKIKSLALILGVFIMSLLVGYLAFATWQEPTATPPGENVDTPLNRGISDQSKSGGLTIWGGIDTPVLYDTGYDVNPGEYFIDPQGQAVTGLSAVLKENVSIGDTSPPTDRKLYIEARDPGEIGIESWAEYAGIRAGADNPTGYGGFFYSGVENSSVYLAYGDYGIWQNFGSKNYFVGSVGIGTDSPTHKLTVYDAGGDSLAIYGSDTLLHLFGFPTAGETKEWTQGIDPSNNYFEISERLGDGTLSEVLVIGPGGNIGIGTIDPGTNKLEVVGGPIKATDGLIIETRTSDPTSPVTGQIWLRTDL